jgi:WXG100 family type VII secretion target
VGALDGAGIFDTYSGMVQSITDDSQSEGEHVLDVAINTTGTLLDTAAFVVDPFAGLITAGVGWLIEHISFLKEPLDALAGNPDDINRVIDNYKTAALEMHQVADDHESSLTGTQSTWTGEASDAYHASMDKLTGELRSMAAAMDGTAAIVGVSGTLVLMLRDQVRDWIASFVADLIEHALVAVATAAITLGSSVAVFIGTTVVRAAALGTKIATKLSKLLAAFARQSTRLAKLSEAMHKIAEGMERFSKYGGISKALYDGAKPYSPEPRR